MYITKLQRGPISKFLKDLKETFFADFYSCVSLYSLLQSKANQTFHCHHLLKIDVMPSCLYTFEKH